MHELALRTDPLQFNLVPSAARTALRNLVAEGEKYFGSDRALRRYAIDPDLFGPEAFQEARRMDSRFVDDGDITPHSI